MKAVAVTVVFAEMVVGVDLVVVVPDAAVEICVVVVECVAAERQKTVEGVAVEQHQGAGLVVLSDLHTSMSSAVVEVHQAKEVVGQPGKLSTFETTDEMVTRII